MVMLISLDSALQYLKYDTSDGNEMVEFFIKAASLAVLNYIYDHSFLNSDGEPDYDSDGEPVGVPEPIQNAVMILVAMQDADRYANDYINPKSRSDLLRTGNIILPRHVHFMLDPYRRPVIA